MVVGVGSAEISSPGIGERPTRYDGEMDVDLGSADYIPQSAAKRASSANGVGDARENRDFGARSK